MFLNVWCWLYAEVRKSFIGEFLLSHPEREIDDNLREFESHFTTVTRQDSELHDTWWVTCTLWCTMLTDLTPTESLRALTVVCPLHTPHCLVSANPRLLSQPQTVNIDTADTWPVSSASDSQKKVTGEYLAFLWVHQVNCHWDLDWNINRPASHIRLTSGAKNQSP